ncbi:MAG: hypothetical protein JO165_07185 [Candidatus Eremiobacteraeota bacterium]|nr:hypothetical protein [Candidatus Eremiobacteraeota bacterium]
MKRCVALLFAGILSACAHQQQAPQQATPPPLLAAQRGRVMPLHAAVREIRFRPYVPAQQLLAVSAIPGLGGNDSPQTRGIAFEYGQRRQALLLSEWPRQGLNVAVGSEPLARTPCVPVRISKNAVFWSTRHAQIVISLQPDGHADGKFVDAEARRLISRGAC